MWKNEGKDDGICPNNDIFTEFIHSSTGYECTNLRAVLVCVKDSEIPHSQCACWTSGSETSSVDAAIHNPRPSHV
jgi:hypothetical protein